MTQIIDCPPSSSAKPALDLEAVKGRQRTMWASGDFAVIGTTLQSVGESLCEAADVAAGGHALDVACGNGNASLAAARRFCVTVGVDYVPALLARARERAQAERLDIAFIEGDAENLPFGDDVFDTVLSTFGVMFAPNQIRAAGELVRVCKPGGRIALASWTPEGFLGDMFRTMAKYVPPAAGLASPLLWGTLSGLDVLFGARVRVVSAERKQFVFRYRTPDHFIQVFRDFYGPTHTAFKALDEGARQALSEDLRSLLARSHRSGSPALAVPGEYLEVVLENR